MHNLKQYNNPNCERPSWNPDIDVDDTSIFIEKQRIVKDFIYYPVYTINDAFSLENCNSLIEQFETQEKYPVGIDGYSNSIENAGSFRAMAWAESLSDKITDVLSVMSEKQYNLDHRANHLLEVDTGFVFPTSLEKEYPKYNLLGSTPWMRFMRYKNGGMHVPHYDAPFINEVQRYVTLYSWVLYLNTPEGDGGEFEFVNDEKNESLNPYFWDRSDWTHMSDDILLSIKPERGKLLIFPHWLCHQVKKYTGDGYRYIIRGDIAYGY